MSKHRSAKAKILQGIRRMNTPQHLDELFEIRRAIDAQINALSGSLPDSTIVLSTSPAVALDQGYAMGWDRLLGIIDRWYHPMMEYWHDVEVILAHVESRVMHANRLTREPKMLAFFVKINEQLGRAIAVADQYNQHFARAISNGELTHWYDLSAAYNIRQALIEYTSENGADPTGIALSALIGKGEMRQEWGKLITYAQSRDREMKDKTVYAAQRVAYHVGKGATLWDAGDLAADETNAIWADEPISADAARRYYTRARQKEKLITG